MRRLLILPLSLVALLAVPASSPAVVTGIGDQQVTMFSNPLFRALHVRTARYIAPYDAMVVPQDRANVVAWMAAARAAHVRPLVAFYHSRVTPERMPSVRTYTRDVKLFIKAFPWIREYQAYNEANRGNVPGLFRSPSPRLAAQYYMALRRACRGCTVIGLDLLDQANIKPSLKYLRQFKRYAKPAPRIWGLHNYSDTNRFSTKRTKAVLRAVKGDVWLTETGGIVKFGRSFPGGATGERRAARALKFMFKLAKSNRRIRRLYIFQWTGAPPDVRFDAGLTNPDGSARPGYTVVRRALGR